MKHLLLFGWVCYLVLNAGFINEVQGQHIFINEIHYDNTGTDTGEGVEIAGPAGTDLTGWQLVPYNGSNGLPYSTINLTGTIPNQRYGFGTLFFPISGLQNGSPDGIALVDADNQVLQFLSYEGSFTANSGPATGIVSRDINFIEDSNTPTNFSLQLSGMGSLYADFTWTAAAPATYNSFNQNQVLLPAGNIVFLNEIHYDNSGTDVNEAVELAGRAGTDLTGWSLVLYNGGNGNVYHTRTLSGIIPDQVNGFGFVSFTYPVNGLQNGSPDGIALINANGEVVQFLSYEGSFIAVGGPANGLTSTDIGVEEISSTPEGYSLQLTGTGFIYSDFTWTSPAASTFKAINNGQQFSTGSNIPEPEPEPESVSIAAARALPANTRVTVTGTLTVVNELGGPAFLQDKTGGIPVFDVQVFNSSTLSIGDSIKVTAVIGNFNQQVQLINVNKLEDFGMATQPIVPLSTNSANITPELEGQLITLPNAIFTATQGLLFPESNYTLTDNSGSVQVRIDGDVASLAGREIPDEPGQITGVLGSFRGTLQILPRFAVDLPGALPYTPAGSTIPTQNTLDVMTWNMEFFGATIPGFGPGNVQLQLQNAARIIDRAKPDIIAVQEISDENLLQQLAALTGYERVCSNRFSYSFDAPDPTFPAQQICFLYKPEVITLINQRALFEAMYDEARSGQSTALNNYPTGTPTSFWSSGRLPFLITVEAQVNGKIERIQLINIHAKSGSGSADLMRRRYDAQALKDTLDRYYPTENIIILGDYNDDVDESIGGGTTTYNSFVNDPDFKVVTGALSEAGLRTFISQDNVIDHIAISNELYDNYLPGSAALVIPFGYIPNYANTTSDHLPVVTRFTINSPNTLPNSCTLILTTKVKQAESYYGMWGAFNGAGAIDLSVLNGTAPYTYRWNAGLASEDVSLASPGTYEVLVTDANGCTGMTTVQVGRKNDFLRVLSAHQDVSSPGGSDGAIDLTVVGGVVPATYRWSNGATTEDLANLRAGTYTVVVTDAFGRKATTTVVVGERGMALALSIAHQNVSAAGKGDGAVDLTVTGGMGPYTYMWNTGARTQDLHYALPGDYTVTVTDAMGATATAMVRVEVGRAPIMARTPGASPDLFTATPSLMAYPNPVTERATISFGLTTSGNYTLDLYDIRGAKVKTLATGKAAADQPVQVELPAAGYAKGVYLLKLITNQGVSSQRILIGR